ncbi:hypothetical protein PLANPX_0062 [Lacipirellula parvula]|uniref:Uncharacterized protein n=1 Tax=Lacipirellula parvula TaxID=2650471 RepID=A0A5K7X1V3_9BACT|nr:hypothetical protein PLANPX_0062 [Lacipirellula parvula]
MEARARRSSLSVSNRWIRAWRRLIARCSLSTLTDAINRR